MLLAVVVSLPITVFPESLYRVKTTAESIDLLNVQVTFLFTVSPWAGFVGVGILGLRT